MIILNAEAVRRYIQKTGLTPFMQDVLRQLTADFSRWASFDKSARHAVHYPHGVIELMPCSDDELYGFKFVNGHPGNADLGRLSIAAFGVLASVETGFPLMLTEMTWLTAIRTACMSALVARYAARPESKALGIIGCGAQAEFQFMAMTEVLPIDTVYYFDIDADAMAKFAANLSTSPCRFVACDDAREVCLASDVLVTATAYKGESSLIKPDWLQAGQFIAGIGGDCPGKTEFDARTLALMSIIVEFLPQTKIEGEIQNLSDSEGIVEFWEIVQGQRQARQSADEIILFDSVGFALEDLSIMKVIYEGYLQSHEPVDSGIIPKVAHPKDLFGALMN